MPNDLKKNAVRGVKWSAISQVIVQALQFVTTAILASIVGADAFGLVGMGLVVVAFLSIFSDLGIGSALIQREELESSLLASAFWANVLMGAVMTALMFFLSPMVAWFYEEPRLIPIVSVMAFNFMILSPTVCGVALLRRSMRFKELSIIETSAAAAGTMAGVTAAVSDFGVWSIVLQSLITSFMRSALTMHFSRCFFRFNFDLNLLRSLFKFSANLTGFSILNFFARNADNLLIGKYLGSEALGFYSLAYRLMLFPVGNISAVVGKVMYPVLAKVQNDNDKFGKAFTTMARFVSLISFPVMAGMALVAYPFVDILWGASWKPTADCIVILAPVGAIQSVATMVGLIYQAKNKTNWMFLWGLVNSIVITIGFLVGLNWGVTGVAWSYAISTGLLLVPLFWIPFSLVDLELSVFWASLANQIIGSIFMVGVVLTTAYLWNTELTSVYEIVLKVPVGVVSYLAFQLVFNSSTCKEVMRLVKSQFSFAAT